jgi:hypothetical protein
MTHRESRVLGLAVCVAGALTACGQSVSTSNVESAEASATSDPLSQRIADALKKRQQEFAPVRDSVLASANEHLTNERYSQALAVVRKYGDLGDAEVNALIETVNSRRAAADANAQQKVEAFEAAERVRVVSLTDSQVCEELRGAKVSKALEAEFVRRGGTADAIPLVARREVTIGIGQFDAVCAWGRPLDVNRTITAGNAREQWVYGESRRKYLYFENGRLTTLQD